MLIILAVRIPPSAFPSTYIVFNGHKHSVTFCGHIKSSFSYFRLPAVYFYTLSRSGSSTQKLQDIVYEASNVHRTLDKYGGLKRDVATFLTSYCIPAS